MVVGYEMRTSANQRADCDSVAEAKARIEVPKPSSSTEVIIIISSGIVGLVAVVPSFRVVADFDWGTS